jgi:lipopolysaccharide export LptBFGC system permease protein LptF
MNKYLGTIIAFLFFLIFAFTPFAEASGTYSTQSVSGSNNTQYATNTADYHQEIMHDGGVPKVTITQAEKWAERKGFEVVHLLQKVVQPFAIIIFILSAFMSMFGAFGNSQLVGRGMWGMAIAIIMYAIVLYAPEILDSAMAWLAS